MNSFNPSDANHRPTVPMDALTEIARQRLDIVTLEQRGRDRLDFYDCAVWTLKAALKDSYLLGHGNAATNLAEHPALECSMVRDLRIDLLEQFAQTAATDAERFVARTSWASEDPVGTLRTLADNTAVTALTPQLATVAQKVLRR